MQVYWNCLRDLDLFPCYIYIHGGEVVVFCVNKVVPCVFWYCVVVVGIVVVEGRCVVVEGRCVVVEGRCVVVEECWVVAFCKIVVWVVEWVVVCWDVVVITGELLVVCGLQLSLHSSESQQYEQFDEVGKEQSCKNALSYRRLETTSYYTCSSVLQWVLEGLCFIYVICAYLVHILVPSTISIWNYVRGV